MAVAIDTPAPSVARLIAIALTMGGLFWGMFLLLAFGPVALFPFPFGVGYLVTVGYIVRAVSVPAFGIRMAIWIASLMVQGYWLLLSIPDITRTGLNLISAWWLFATVRSGIAIAKERRNRA